jgi:ParB-like chromosome segregation protein Spo0J
MRPELHPACAAFPALPEEDLVALAADIRAKGLLEPITLTPDGLLLDGRCRWDACERESIEPRTVTYDGDDPVGFAASKNRHRRHLSKAQMVMIVARLSALQSGSNQHKRVGAFPEGSLLQLEANTFSKTQPELAEQSGLSRSYLQFAKVVLTKGEPNVIAMVESGQVRPSVAAEAVRRHDRATQAGWTVDDVERIGRAVINSYPSKQANPKAAKSAKPKPNKMINPPYLKMEWPTEEELDYPKPGSSVEEYDAFFRKYGRTPLWPKAIKEMQDADSLTSGLVHVVRNLTNSHHPDADQFFAHLDHLAMHKREPDKTNGAQTDFVRKGRETLAMLEAALPKALDLLHAMEAKLAARKEPSEKTGLHLVQ